MRKMLGTFVALASLVGCSGGGSSVKGVTSFDVKSARAIHFDGGTSKPMVGVIMTDADLSCADANPTLPDGGKGVPPGRSVFISFPDQGAKQYAVVPTFGSDGGFSSEIGSQDDISVAYVNGLSGGFSVGGNIDVTSSSSSSVKGSFDVQTVDAFSLLALAFGGGHVDNGKLVLADGGAVPTESLSGNFDAQFCP